MSMATTPDRLRRYEASDVDGCERCRLEIHPGDVAAWDTVCNERLCGGCAELVAEARRG